jgi:hypothetical protein
MNGTSDAGSGERDLGATYERIGTHEEITRMLKLAARTIARRSMWLLGADRMEIPAQAQAEGLKRSEAGRSNELPDDERALPGKKLTVLR